MSKSLIDISNKIEPDVLEIYETISIAALKENIHFFIIGASARDLILEYGYNIKAGRITQDIDVAIKVSSWDEFEKLKSALIKTGKMNPTQSPHRMKYEPNGFYIDIIPFGSIEDDKHLITWPFDHSVSLNVIGFQDALNNAQIVRMRREPSLDIPVVDIPQYSLKVIHLYS